MSLRGEDALILAQDYVDETLKGAGALKGQDGKDGVSPVISVNTSTSDTYKLDITDKNGTITTPNLVGKQGLQGIPRLSESPLSSCRGILQYQQFQCHISADRRNSALYRLLCSRQN